MSAKFYEVAKLFGLQLNEEFKLLNKDYGETFYRYCFLEDGLYEKVKDGELNIRNDVLINMLNGKLTVIEIKKFSSDEIFILKHLEQKYKWLARDKNGDLLVYQDKPKKLEYDGLWNNCGSYKSMTAFGHLFKNVKWEDEEPVDIKDILTAS